MVNKFRSTLILGLFAILFSACASDPRPQYDYSAFLQTKPRSILVLMPTNESTEIKASSAVLTNAIFPLSEAGYYIFDPSLVNDTFKFNGVYEPSEIHQISVNKLKQIFGADSVLYINIKEYGSTYMVLDSVTKVSVEAKLVDTNTGNIMWQKTASATNSSQGSSDIASMLLNALIKQIADTLSDVSYELSARADRILFAQDCYDCLLYGPYSPYYGKDSQLTK